MKNITLFLIALQISQIIFSQEIIKLPHENKTELVWQGGEKSTYSEQWQTELISNVSTPTLQIFRPAPSLNTGASVVIAPGGGLRVLSINSEGVDVAKWLNTKGITAFVLKYRLLPESDSALPNETEDHQNTSSNMTKKVAKVLELATSDGLNAMSYVKNNAKALGIDRNKIGFMGFSAGGAVTMGVTFNYTKTNRPDFIVPVYPWMTVLGTYSVPQDAPPMLIICASDDQYDLAHESVDLYSAWSKLGKSAALHMYSKGGHGFGMKTQDLPSDNWISRFYEWTLAEKIVVPAQQP
ncbi:alpha/beta hydrolase [Arenibacter sp. BSSL-BM3]|uniref:Alpha/beta hydrolase n=1 Tax=Arenibacter arenosicollis TaxID=2762274 RepID=A0ABR7QP74_9FLAO|nr:alpha/beta hydrolase [Arenibacter arenosicollis]MBC8768987.1 alpha/beta hydrolase [Arenibacter arenosicollis]